MVRARQNPTTDEYCFEGQAGPFSANDAVRTDGCVVLPQPSCVANAGSQPARRDGGADAAIAAGPRATAGRRAPTEFKVVACPGNRGRSGGGFLLGRVEAQREGRARPLRVRCYGDSTIVSDAAAENGWVAPSGAWRLPLTVTVNR